MEETDGLVFDRYKAGAILEQVPELDPAARKLLLRKNNTEEIDGCVLSLGVLQNLLSNKRDEARRFFLIIDELSYQNEAVKKEFLFAPCGNCRGDGHLNKRCKVCHESGKCPKCRGEGSYKSDLGNSMDCTTCRGSGICSECKGVGKISSICPKCDETGNVINQQYCEIRRDQIVRNINAESSQGKHGSITAAPSSGADKALIKFPGLKTPGQDFYLSDDYSGGMDTNILVACVLHSLLENRPDQAKRFEIMMRVQYPAGEVLHMERYIHPCKKCDKTGRIEQDCRSCDGRGECARCTGSGQRTSEIGKDKIHCTTCRGTGCCKKCKGTGKLTMIGKECKGRGQIIELQRTKIKLGLLVDKMNTYYDKK